MDTDSVFNFLFELEKIAEQLWSWIVQTAIFTTATALFIIAFKVIFKNRIKAKWHFLVWGILLIRIVFPVLPSTPMSVFNAVNVSNEKISDSSVVNITTEEGYYGHSDEQHYNISFGENKIPKTDISGEFEFSPVAEVSAFHIGNYAALVWAVGAVVLAVYFIIILLIYRHRLKKKRTDCDEKALAILNACKEKLNIKRNVRLYFADTTPVLIGLFKPCIYIPRDYEENELKTVLTHELCHMKHLDVLWSAIAALVLCLNWYNPIIWLSFFMFKRDIELYCDERTLKYIDDKQGYAMLLLNTAGKKKYVLGTSSLQSGKFDVKRRIRYLAKFKKPKVFIIVIAVVLAAALAVICLTNAMGKDNRPGVSDEVNPNISYDYNLLTHTLSFYGEGDMKDYEYSPSWSNQHKPINIEVNNGITRICKEAFFADIDGNTGKPRNDFQYTERVRLADSITDIGASAFFNCLSLQEINLPKNLKNIGEAAFDKCKSIKSIEIPDGVTVISDYLFDECESLESVKLGRHTKMIGGCAFSETKLSEIEIPDTVTKIGYLAFFDCKFTSVTIPPSVTFIGEEAFGYCNDEEKRITKIKDFTIRGYKNSAAEKYAAIHGFKFEATGETEINKELTKVELSDFYIETNNSVPLKPTKFSDDHFYDAFLKINTAGQIIPDFTLYELRLYKGLSFRKANSENQWYYCIIEADTEYHDKAYLFFEELNGIWVCRNYIAVDENMNPFDMRYGGNTLETDDGKQLLSIISDIDK